ncbi:MAG: ester cyclase [Oscillochloridaceae bacterium umkhey_bin13]
MGTQENKEVVRLLVDTLWNQGDFGAVEQYFAATFRNYNPNLPFVTDRSSLTEWMAATRASFPDVHMYLEALVAEDDLVMTRWTLRGTHLGPVGDMPPTGRMVTVTGATTYRLLAGQVVECWWAIDVYTMLKQIGAFNREMVAA